MKTLNNMRLLLALSNNNTSSKASVYEAVIVVWPVRKLTQFDWCIQTYRQVTAEPQMKPTKLDCEVACGLLPSTPTVAVYYYWAGKPMLVISSHGLSIFNRFILVDFLSWFSGRRQLLFNFSGSRLCICEFKAFTGTTNLQKRFNGVLIIEFMHH